MPRIRDIAAVCKSKNAGPFELTVDVVFDDPALFDKVKCTGVLGPDLFARLYGVRAEDVLFTVYDAALAFKATLPRLVPAGDIGDTDVYGAPAARPSARRRHSDLSHFFPAVRETQGKNCIRNRLSGKNRYVLKMLSGSIVAR